MPRKISTLAELNKRNRALFRSVWKKIEQASSDSILMNTIFSKYRNHANRCNQLQTPNDRLQQMLTFEHFALKEINPLADRQRAIARLPRQKKSSDKQSSSEILISAMRLARREKKELKEFLLSDHSVNTPQFRIRSEADSNLYRVEFDVSCEELSDGKRLCGEKEGTPYIERNIKFFERLWTMAGK